MRGQVVFRLGRKPEKVEDRWVRGLTIQGLLEDPRAPEVEPEGCCLEVAQDSEVVEAELEDADVVRSSPGPDFLSPPILTVGTFCLETLEELDSEDFVLFSSSSLPVSFNESAVENG